MTSDATRFERLSEVRRGDTQWIIGVINGPNMSNLGARSRRIYGDIESIDALNSTLQSAAAGLDVTLKPIVSNYEGELLEYIHSTASVVNGYIINPAGITTTGEATRDALVDSGRPWIEVHFANISSPELPAARAQWSGVLRSQFTRSASGVVMGFGHWSYIGALVCLVLQLDEGTISD